MTKTQIILSSALSTLLMFSLGKPAHAQAELSHAKVRAELQEAIRMGDIPVSENGQSPREMFPSAYPARPALAGKTREQVRAELQEAIRMGDILIADGSQTAREIHPSAYPARVLSH